MQQSAFILAAFIGCAMAAPAPIHVTNPDPCATGSTPKGQAATIHGKSAYCLSRGESLKTCEYLGEPNWYVEMQNDGNFVEYAKNDDHTVTAVWSVLPVAKDSGDYTFTYTTDGDLTLTDSTGIVYSSADTSADDSNKLCLVSDGTFALYNHDGSTWSSVWTSGSSLGLGWSQ